ncbi:MAG: hypothetical protein MI919_05095, partial [Holophagales bacterium]|nr:hypothetical protein [Holophagales bacterium]
MFFESRLQPPEVSEEFAPLARWFAGGRAREARRWAVAMRGERAWRKAGDVLLCSDLARAAAFHREFFAIVHLGRRRFPEDRLLAFEAARVATIRNRWREAIGAMENLLPGADDGERALLEALLASAQAQMGFARRSERHRDRALALFGRSAAVDPRVAYELAYAGLCLRRFGEAAEHAGRAVAGAPRWARARLLHAEASIARGQVERARA